jgi:type I restriction enzyme, S subunit
VIGDHELPEGWVQVILEDIITPSRIIVQSSNRSELPFIGLEHVEAETMKLLGSGLARDMKSHSLYFSSGNVLYGRLRPYLNKVFRPDFEGACSAEFIVFPKCNYLEPRYLQYFLNSWNFKKFASHLNAGDRPRVDWDQLKVFPFSFPPLPEQQRIVSAIEQQFSRLDESVALLKQSQKQLKRYRTSVLKAAVEGELTAQWRATHPDLEPASELLKRILVERRAKWEAEQIAKGRDPQKVKYVEPVEPDVSALGKLPDGGWVWTSLESISEALGGFAFSSKDFSSKGYQVIKMGNLKDNILNLKENPSFLEDVPPEILEKYQLQRNDLLITLTGTRNKRDYGYVVIVKNEKDLLLNQRIARLRFHYALPPIYYLIALQDEQFRDRFFQYETGNVG